MQTQLRMLKPPPYMRMGASTHMKTAVPNAPCELTNAPACPTVVSGPSCVASGSRRAGGSHKTAGLPGQIALGLQGAHHGHQTTGALDDTKRLKRNTRPLHCRTHTFYQTHFVLGVSHVPVHCRRLRPPMRPTHKHRMRLDGHQGVGRYTKQPLDAT